MMLGVKYGIEVLTCNENELTRVKDLVSDMSLDNNDLNEEQFIVAKRDDEIFGFGRLRTYNDCQELCTLGVIEPERLRGIGRGLARRLIKKSNKPLYVVTVIPEFFKKLGFTVVDLYPTPIRAKMNYCTDALWVPESYVAMVFSE
jgi:N-acetylglutamate synthase-like GNAT family acetyltransferase